MTHNIALVCTGTSCLDENLVNSTADHLKTQHDLEAFYSQDTYKALPAEQRANIFLHHLFDSNIHCIASMRGGEGTADILSFINAQKNKIAALKPKLLIGFSDFTPLLIFFSQTFNWPVVHGPGFLKFHLQEIDKHCEQQTINIIKETNNSIELSQLQPLNKPAKIQTHLESTLTGGTLSLINISIKDIWEIDTNNKIVIIEDIGERAHVISRTLKYLHRIGCFNNAAAIIFGDFNTQPVGSDKNHQRKNSESINKTLTWFAHQCNFPVLQTNEFGHGNLNTPLPFSTPVTLQLGKNPQLTCKFTRTEQKLK